MGDQPVPSFQRKLEPILTSLCTVNAKVKMDPSLRWDDEMDSGFTSCL